MYPPPLNITPVPEARSTAADATRRGLAALAKARDADPLATLPSNGPVARLRRALTTRAVSFEARSGGPDASKGRPDRTESMAIDQGDRKDGLTT